MGKRVSHPGIDERHSRKCATATGAGKRCTCSPTYRVRVSRGSRGGRDTAIRTFPTFEEALAYKLELEDAIAGRTRATAKAPALRTAWPQFVEEALAGRARNRSMKPYSARTIASYDVVVRSYVLPLAFENIGIDVLPITRLTEARGLQSVVDAVCDDLDARGLTMEQARTAGFALTAMLRWAYATPGMGIDRLPPRVKYPPPQPKRERVLTDAEMDALWNAAEERGGFAYVMFVVLANTGGRIEDACGMTWADVDLDGRAIDLRSKTDAGHRRVFIDDETAAVLRRWRLESGRPGATAPVLPAKDGGPTTRHGRPRYYLRKIAGDAGVQGLTFHVLRHTHASTLAAAGADAAALAKRMGHSDPAFTTRRYIHPLEDRERELADLVQLRTRTS